MQIIWKKTSFISNFAYRNEWELVTPPHPLYLVNHINCPHVINLRDINNNQNQRPEDNSHKGRYGG